MNPAEDNQPPAYSAAENPPMQPQGYPAPPLGYPAQPPAYPAQPLSYPAQPEGCYPLQPLGYPAQPQGYGYPVQQDFTLPGAYPETDVKQYPPDYSYPQQGFAYPPQSTPVPQPQQQAPATNVVVVQAQPAVSTTVVVRNGVSGDYFLTLSIVMTVLCTIFGGWWNLIFTIAAMGIASAARRDAAAGRTTEATVKGRIALGLNISSIVLYIVIIALIIGFSSSEGVSYSSPSDSSYYYSYYYYSSSYSYYYYSYYYYSYYYYSYYYYGRRDSTPSYYCKYCDTSNTHCSYSYGISAEYYTSYSPYYKDSRSYYCS